MNTKETLTAQTNYVISKKLHDILIGTLLGDGCLSSHTTGRIWNYRCLQSLEQKEYLFHKYELFQNWCLSAPNYGEVKSPNEAGKLLKRWYFNTRRLGLLKYYGDLFYEPIYEPTFKRIKRVPNNIKELLSPTALAYWFMDDGDQKWKGHSRAVRISVNSFSKSDCELLCSVLHDKYDLRTSLQKADSSKLGIQQYRLYISAYSYEILRDLIYPQLLPSMLYKFPT